MTDDFFLFSVLPQLPEKEGSAVGLVGGISVLYKREQIDYFSPSGTF
jgi:hypothetical protein